MAMKVCIEALKMKLQLLNLKLQLSKMKLQVIRSKSPIKTQNFAQVFETWANFFKLQVQRTEIKTEHSQKEIDLLFLGANSQ